MLRSRILAVSAALAVVGTSALVASGSATAAVGTNDPTAEWANTAASFTPLAGIDVPLASGWGVSSANGTADLRFAAAGLSGSFPYTSTIVHPVAEAVPGADLTQFGSTFAALTTGTGSVNVEITLLNDGTPLALRTNLASTGSTVIVPDDATWTASASAGQITAGEQGTLADFQDDLADDASVTGYGAQVFGGLGGDSTMLAALEADDATTYFTPSPSGTIIPATPTVSQFSPGGTGVTITGVGFLPGETVQFGFGGADSGGDIAGLTAVADANGSFTQVVVAPQAVTAGTQYFVTAIGQSTGVDVVYGVVPVADPATPAAPVATPVHTTATFTG